jgi:DNA mismatch endonuclease (patch repair protein)
LDNRSAASRSALMRQVKAKNTIPERTLRTLLHRWGYRFRLHRSDLPGKPDIVFPSRRKVIFVHGCFWHRHPNCSKGSIPKSRADYWIPKLQRNVERDIENMDCLQRLGWQVLIVWQCELHEKATLFELKHFLGPPHRVGPAKHLESGSVGSLVVQDR